MTTLEFARLTGHLDPAGIDKLKAAADAYKRAGVAFGAVSVHCGKRAGAPTVEEQEAGVTASFQVLEATAAEVADELTRAGLRIDSELAVMKARRGRK